MNLYYSVIKKLKCLNVKWLPKNESLIIHLAFKSLHREGPAMAKALSPKVFHIILGTTSNKQRSKINQCIHNIHSATVIVIQHKTARILLKTFPGKT